MEENNKAVVIRWYGPGTPRIIDPSCITKGWDYIFLTDDLSHNSSDIWESLLMRFPGYSGEHESKIIKAMFPIIYPKYDWCVIIDTEKYIIDSDLDALIYQLQPETEFAALRHRVTNCTYHEIARNRKYKRDSNEALDAITTTNLTTNLPVKSGLYDTSIVIYKCTEKMCEALKTWAEMIKVCKRDQCSIVTAMREHKVNTEYLQLANYKHYKKLRPTSNVYAEKSIEHI